MDLNITILEFILLPQNKIYLPEHPGSSLRGAFGHGLRELTCHNKNKKCKECMLKDKCPYSLFFNPFLTYKEKKMTSGRFHNKPRPFVFEFDSAGKKEFNPGEPIKFRINIFGKMYQYIPYVIESWKILQSLGIGKDLGEFILREIWLDNPLNGKSAKIYDYKDETIKNKDLSISIDDIKRITKSYPDDRIQLIFTSPTLIKYNGSFLNRRLGFKILMKNVFRRLSSLAAFYGEELDIVFDEYLKEAESIKIIEEELKWTQWYRFSSRQYKKIDMQGIIGTMTYEGRLNKFLKYLTYGQFIHIGKNTVFGQGKYILI
ncbi:MAG: CRISPR system precrRNA processing endoribonuclease RAMP protein Cas6 [Halanaerobiales bacterium]